MNKYDNIWPTKAAEEDPEKCYSIYWNLYEMFSSRASLANGALIIREMVHTTRCDTLKSFRQVREGLRNVIDDDDSLRNIIAGSPTEDDNFRANSAVAHHDYWIRKQLWDALSFSDKLYYFSAFKFYETVSILGMIVGSGGLLYKWGTSGRARQVR